MQQVWVGKGGLSPATWKTLNVPFFVFPSLCHRPLCFILKHVIPTKNGIFLSPPQVPRMPRISISNTHSPFTGEMYLDLMISVKHNPSPGPCGQTLSMHKWRNNGERNHKASSSGAINCTGRTIVGDEGEANHIYLESDRNLCLMLATGTIQGPSKGNQQLSTGTPNILYMKQLTPKCKGFTIFHCYSSAWLLWLPRITVQMTPPPIL